MNKFPYDLEETRNLRCPFSEME